MKEETVFLPLSKRNQFLILSAFFVITIATLSLPKHIKIMFKVFKFILNINSGRQLCSHQTVQCWKTGQKPIQYDVNMALATTDFPLFCFEYISKSLFCNHDFTDLLYNPLHLSTHILFDLHQDNSLKSAIFEKKKLS